MRYYVLANAGCHLHPSAAPAGCREETQLRQAQAQLEQRRREIEQAWQQALALLAQTGG